MSDLTNEWIKLKIKVFFGKPRLFSIYSYVKKNFIKTYFVRTCCVKYIADKVLTCIYIFREFHNK